MRNAAAWLVELAYAAPGVDLTLLRLLAATLAHETRADALLIVADVLRGRAAELLLDGNFRLAADLTALDGILGGQAKVAAALAAREV
jgi:hypothetical protein